MPPGLAGTARLAPPLPLGLKSPSCPGSSTPPGHGVSLCMPLLWVGLLSIAPVVLHIQLLPTVMVGAGLWGIPMLPREAGQPALSWCSAVTDTAWPCQVTDGGFRAGFISGFVEFLSQGGAEARCPRLSVAVGIHFQGTCSGSHSLSLAAIPDGVAPQIIWV